MNSWILSNAQNESNEGWEESSQMLRREMGPAYQEYVLCNVVALIWRYPSNVTCHHQNIDLLSNAACKLQKCGHIVQAFMHQTCISFVRHVHGLFLSRASRWKWDEKWLPSKCLINVLCGYLYDFRLPIMFDGKKTLPMIYAMQVLQCWRKNLCMGRLSAGCFESWCIALCKVHCSSKSGH